MLTHLVVRQFAIIEHLEVPFREGYTAITGETGAGKSILVDALNLILGGRASTDVIRTDEEEATVEGVFEPTASRLEAINERLASQGIETGGELVVRRRIRRNGRNKVFINGSLSTVSTLREVTRGLVDISGQHEHYSLTDVDGHVDILDKFAELGEQRREMAEAYAEWRELDDQLRELRERASDRLNRIDFLEYQLDEIEELGPEPGEDDDLQDEFDRLKHAEQIGESVREAVDLAYEGPSAAVERLAEATDALREAAGYDDDLEDLVDRFETARIEVEEAAMELQDYAARIDVDPERIDQVVERLDELNRLKRKHDANSVDALLERAEEMREEIDELRHAEERTGELEEQRDRAEERAVEVAADLGERRRRAAERFEERVEAELADLNMSETRFEVAIEPESVDRASRRQLDDGDEAPLGERGFDDVEFRLAPNVGEELAPLAEIASGGELSRVMLAIKSVLMERDAVETYVFDEVDTGIGGTTAEVVGEKIARTAEAHQIVCITHLAQIAARADHQYRVEKFERDGRTHSTVEPIDREERVGELARMLEGEDAADETHRAAQAMLEA